MTWNVPANACSGVTWSSRKRGNRRNTMLTLTCAPGASGARDFIFPVAVNLGGAHQLGADAAGSLWEAGGERSDPARFFRMNADGTIDRSTAFPAPGGSTLHADGTLAVSIDGALWASATTSSGHDYLIRFVPTP